MSVSLRILSRPLRICILISQNIGNKHSFISKYRYKNYSTMTDPRKTCIFCKIYDEDLEGKVIYKDEEHCVFPDIRPAAKHHYLVITREHIPNPKVLGKNRRDIVEKLVEIGKRVLQEKGGDLSDVRFGFHWPPFHSIAHLHLHVISPTNELGFVSRLIFRPDSYWFYSPEAVLAYLDKEG